MRYSMGNLPLSKRVLTLIGPVVMCGGDREVQVSTIEHGGTEATAAVDGVVAGAASNVSSPATSF